MLRSTVTAISISPSMWHLSRSRLPHYFTNHESVRHATCLRTVTNGLRRVGPCRCKASWLGDIVDRPMITEFSHKVQCRFTRLGRRISLKPCPPLPHRSRPRCRSEESGWSTKYTRLTTVFHVSFVDLSNCFTSAVPEQLRCPTRERHGDLL